MMPYFSHVKPRYEASRSAGRCEWDAAEAQIEFVTSSLPVTKRRGDMQMQMQVLKPRQLAEGLSRVELKPPHQ